MNQGRHLLGFKLNSSFWGANEADLENYYDAYGLQLQYAYQHSFAPKMYGQLGANLGYGFVPADIDNQEYILMSSIHAGATYRVADYFEVLADVNGSLIFFEYANSGSGFTNSTYFSPGFQLGGRFLF